MKNKYLGLIGVLMVFFPAFLSAQLTVTTGIPVTTLVQDVLVGQGVTVTNVVYTGAPNAIGRFQTGPTPTNLGISSGIIMSTGIVNDTWAPIGSPQVNTASWDNYYAGHSLLTTLAGYTTYDAAILDFDFVPLADTIKFRYVFGSEEYHEFVNSGFNDVFAFFITGPNPLGGNYTNFNIAKLPGTATPVSIDNVNNGYTFNDCATGPCFNCAYFVDNCYGTSIVFDAFTVVLTAWAKVTPCQNYHLKLAIADAGDGILDSGVFLEAGSLNTNAVTLNSYVTIPAAGPDAIEGCNNSVIEFALPGPTPSDRIVPFTIGGTATNGVDYQTIPTSVTIPAGQSMTTLSIIPFMDGIPEGVETVILTVQTSPCTQDVVSVNILDYTPLSAAGTGSTTICGGAGPVPIGVNVSNGAPSYSYSWSNGLGSNQSVSVNPTTTTTYTVTVTDACGQTATANVTVTISNNANISITPVSPTICAGGNVDLTASGGSTYNWSTGQSGSTINVAPAVTTNYTVTGTDAFGCSGTASVTVNVGSALNVTVTPANPQICAGTSTNLQAGGATNYSWSHGPTTSLVSVSPTTTTTYTVTGSDNFGCSGSASATVTVNPNPTVTVTPSAVSICQGTSTSIQGNGAQSYSWSGGQQTSGITVSPGSTTTYTVTGTDANGCSGTASSTVTVNPNPVITAIADPDNLCLGGSTTLTAGGGSSYVWNNGSTAGSFTENPSQTTTYSVVGTDANGCTGTAQVTVTVYTNLTVSITPQNGEICEGDNLSLTVVSNGTAPVFTWNTGQNSSVITVTPPTTTDYSVSVIDNYGCTGSAQTTVIVNPIPDVMFEGAPLSGCAPVTVIFMNLSDPGNADWDFGDGTGSTSSNPSHTYSNSGNYTVSLTVSAAGCENTFTLTDYVNVYPIPIAGFHPSSTWVFEDESTVMFADESMGASVWFWDFGTGNQNDVSNNQNPEFTFPGTGEYVVWQYVENQWGCSDSTSMVIHVKPVVTFYVPNAFSPNDDGQNDYFMPYGNNVEPDDYQMLIYDRWGKQLFRSDNLNTPWDGTSSTGEGKIAQGTYVYVIKVTLSGIEKIYEGIVTVVY
jgi:gliding motility-associated-like protein